MRKTAKANPEAEKVSPPPGGEVIPFPILPVPLAAISPPEIIGLSRMLCSPEALEELERRVAEDAV